MCRLRTRLYHIALGVGMCLSIGACDLLEVDPTSVITSDSFWQTESDAQVCEIEDRIRGEPFHLGRIAK